MPRNMFPLYVTFFLFSALVVPRGSLAATFCETQQMLTERGSYFSSHEEYGYQDNLLFHHFKIESPAGSPVVLRFSLLYFDEACTLGSPTDLSFEFTMPSGGIDWSVYFISPGKLEIRDSANVLLKEYSLPNAGNFPSYAKVLLKVARGGDSELVSRVLTVSQNASPPPEYTSAGEPTPGCPSSGAFGDLFDGYERTEYVDGLLRIHMRLKTLSAFPKTFTLRSLRWGEQCSSLTISAPLSVTTPAYTRYHSIRFTTPTHWELWDDEREIKIECPGCAGNILENTPLVSFEESIPGNGFTLYMKTTPLPPTRAPTCSDPCVSNILFLPGIMGSRLDEGGERRWEPGDDADIVALKLDEDGKSLSPNVEATEVIDIFDGPLFVDVGVYGSFLEDLEEKRAEGTIAEYAAVPYDWRLSFSDILADGSIEATLRALAASSKTGKVAIVAHSNGGLLAKALINALGDDASDLVDQLILVGVPQIGTPKAAGTILHGYDAGALFVISDERARDFAKNAPFIYQLLPHADYASFAGASIETPVVSFEGSEATQLFFDAYGSVIDSQAEMKNFLTGVEGRGDPVFEDLKNPAKGNGDLFDAASALEQEIGSLWQPPTGVEVHQIAGIGEDTLAGITYKTVQECTEYIPAIRVCLAYESRLSYTPQEVVDGDGTVVVPSALAMSTSSEQVKRWWVDLDDYHSAHSTQLGPYRKNHKNLFEIDELRAHIFKQIFDSTPSAPPTYIFESAPNIEDTNRLRFTLHSPLTLSATANDGAVYPATRYGEVQVLTLPANLKPTLSLKGEKDGSFTLNIEELEGGVLVATTTFSGIPSSASTSVVIAFPDGTIENAGDLTVDYEGDGVTDFALAPEGSEEVSIPEPSLSALLMALKSIIGASGMKENLTQRLLKRVENLEKKIEKKKERNAKLLTGLERTVSKEEEKGRIASADTSELLAFIDILEAGVGDIALDSETLALLKAKITSLNLKESLKKGLSRRIEVLEKKQQLTSALLRLTNQISKRAARGDIGEGDAKEMLDLLVRIESML
jgi:pimeloyl-ACP methyl ester carboxylesterase